MGQHLKGEDFFFGKISTCCKAETKVNHNKIEFKIRHVLSSVRGG